MEEEIIEFLESGVHASFDDIVDVDFGVVNEGVDGLPYTLWELLEHLRLSQEDILEFFGEYEEKDWPDDYWPDGECSREEWKESVRLFKSDLRELKNLVKRVDLEGEFKEGYTYGEQLLKVLKHNSYHLGQMVVLERLLGVWE